MAKTIRTAGDDTNQPATGSPNAAQQAFGQYKAKIATVAPLTPVGWGIPPSMTIPPVGYPYPTSGMGGMHPMGSLAERLGATVRHGVDLLNAALASGTSALTGLSNPPGAMGYGCGGGCGGGCGCGYGCGYDCCEAVGCGCCRPGVSACGCC